MGQWVYHASPEVNAASQYPTILGVCVALTTLMTIIVALRIWIRSGVVKALGADDWVIICSMICSIVYNALGITQSRYGLGLPLALRPTESLNKYTTVNFAGRPFYMAGITGFKVALCFAYLRITSRSYNHKFFNYRNTIWIMMVFSIATHLGGTLVLIFQCNPVQKSWRPSTKGHCLRNDITFYVLAALTIICDIIIFVLPIPLLLRLEINIKKKFGLITVFTLGLFTTVCSILRMCQIHQIAVDGNSTMLVLWGTIEMNVGIILTCLPTLAPLLSYFREKTLVASERFHGYEKSGEGRDRKSSAMKPSIQLSGLSQYSIHGVSSFHTTTITANEPDADTDNSTPSSRRVGIEGEASDNLDSAGGRPLSIAQHGFITRTTEVSIHREDMK